MISVGLRSKTGARTFEFETFEELEKALERVLKDREMVDAIIRCPDDDVFYRVLGYVGSVTEGAIRTAQMVAGAQVPIWKQTFVSVDGPGWRTILAPDALVAQQQPMPPMGLPNGRRAQR